MNYFVNSPETPNQEDVNQALKDFGFYHDLADVKRMYAEYSNNKQYGYAGGVMDQPDSYWHDMYIMKNLELWVKHFAPLIGFVDEISIFAKEKMGLPLL